MPGMAASTATRPVAGDRPADVPTVAHVALLALAIGLAFVGLRLAAAGWDPSRFVTAGDEFTDPARAPAELDVAEGSLGYDGQYFYRLARNPLSREPVEHGIRLDRPAYRQQRIGYPAVVWLSSLGGQRALVPWALIGVNVGATVAIAALGAALARRLGRSTLFGLVFALWPGLLVCLARDLSEVVAGAFVLLALLLVRRGGRWGPALALTAAVLTRETALVPAAAVVGASVLGRLPVRGWLASLADRARAVPALVGLVPIGVYAAWQAFLAWWWAGTGNAAGETASFFTLPPLGALVRGVAGLVAEGTPLEAYLLLQLALVLLTVGLLASALRERDAGLPHERLSLVASVALFTLLPTWDRNIVFLRYANELVLVGLIVFLAARRVRVELLPRLIGLLWLTTAVVWVFVE